MKVSILLITWNKIEFLRIAIKTILGSLDGEFEHEILILNQGSTDGTTEYLETISDDRVRIYSVPKNIGLNGYGFLQEFATGDMIVTMDDDIFYISPFWERIFSHILNTKFDESAVGYVGAYTLNKDGGMRKDVWGFGRTDSNVSLNICPVGGWFAAIKPSVLDAIGGFHTGKKEMFLEDSDIQGRAWTAGYICGITPHVRVFHANSREYYKALHAVDTYNAKSDMALDVGIALGRI